MAQGDFTPSVILQVKAKAEQMWADGQYALEYEPNAETAKAVLENQTARIRKLTGPEMGGKDETMSITWLNTCDMVDEACVNTCDWDAPELSSKAQPIAPNLCRQVKFSIDREKNRTSTYSPEEEAALGQMNAIKILDEWLDKTTISKMKAFAGVNLAPAPYTYSGVTNTTSIPAANYNRKLVAQLMLMATLNKIPSYYLVDNGTLYTDWMNAQFDGANGEGKGDAARRNALKVYFDLFGFTAAGITEDTFVVGRSAMAIVTENRFTSTPIIMEGQGLRETIYTVNSRVLPGVTYDVTYQLKCKNVNGRKHYVDQWMFEAKGGIYLNPASCNGTTGIFSLTQS